jgi:type VI secretion system protein ImpH
LLGGTDAGPPAAGVRLVANPFGTYASSEIEALEWPNADALPWRLAVNVMGLIGPMGVLPPYYADLVVRALRGGSPALCAFLDLLHDRSLRLFGESAVKYRLPLAAEAAAAFDDQPSRSLLALAGFAAEPLPHGAAPPACRFVQGLADDRLIYFAGHLAHWPRSAVTLEALARAWLGLPIRVEQFRAHWLAIAPDERSELPPPGASRGRFCRLGVDATLGERFRDASSAIRLIVGPVDGATFRDLLPDRSRLAALGRLVQLYVGPGILVDVQVILANPAVPALQLRADADPGPRLGWSTWLGPPKAGRDPDDAVLVPPG